MILRGADETILHRSGRIVDHLVQTDFSVQVDPIDWVRYKESTLDILQFTTNQCLYYYFI